MEFDIRLLGNGWMTESFVETIGGELSFGITPVEVISACALVVEGCNIDTLLGFESNVGVVGDTCIVGVAQFDDVLFLGIGAGGGETCSGFFGERI